MPATLRSILVSGAMVLAAALMPAAAVAQSYEQTFTVFNDSHYRINHVYVSPLDIRCEARLVLLSRLGHSVLAHQPFVGRIELAVNDKPVAGIFLRSQAHRFPEMRTGCSGIELVP